MKSFTFDFAISKRYSDDSGRRLIEGIATVETVDSEREVVVFDSVEKAFSRYMQKNPVLCRHHNLSEPIGKVVEYEPRRDNGIRKMWIRAEIDNPSVQESYIHETWDQIKSGTLRSFSINGVPKKRWIEKRAGKKVRMVSIERLGEISVVAAGMHEDTLFNVVSKSFESDDFESDNFGSEKLDEEDLAKIAQLVQTTVKDELNNVEKSFDNRFERIEKHLEIPDEEEEEFQQKVSEAVSKALKNESQLQELKKAFGSGSPDPSGDPGDPGGNPEDEELKELKKQYNNFQPKSGNWTPADVAEYQELEEKILAKGGF